MLRDQGEFRARVSSEELSSEAQAAASDKLDDIVSSNERYQLANIRTFPHESAVRQMMVSMDNLLRDAREPGLVGVPIVASSNDSAAKLVGLPSGTKLDSQTVRRLLDNDPQAVRDVLNALGRALAKTS